MARRIARTPRASLDLIEIWTFIADDNEKAADRLIDRIGATLLSLRDNPLMGRARPELGTDLRSFPVGSYIAYFKPLPDGIELVRVLSGYMDISQDDFG